MTQTLNHEIDRLLSGAVASDANLGEHIEQMEMPFAAGWVLVLITEDVDTGDSVISGASAPHDMTVDTAKMLYVGLMEMAHKIRTELIEVGSW